MAVDGWTQSLGLRDHLLVVVLLGVGNHGLASGLPVGWAHLAVHVHVLEGLHQPQVLVGVSADGEVVDGGVANDTILVDDVGGTVGDTNVTGVTKAAVVGGDGLVEVGDEGDIHGSEAAVLSGLEGVLHVGELGVDGDGDEFAADFPELLGLVVEGDDLSGADEGEVEGVEEEHDVLAVVGLEVNVYEVSVEPGGGDEAGGGFSDQGHILKQLWLRFVIPSINISGNIQNFRYQHPSPEQRKISCFSLQMQKQFILEPQG